MRRTTPSPRCAAAARPERIRLRAPILSLIHISYSIGSTANVKVVKLMTFGAFAEIVPGVDGLIHISQIADHRIDKPGDVLSEGQMVDVRITDIDMDNKKVSLSIRALLEDARNQPGEADEVVASSEAEE